MNSPWDMLGGAIGQPMQQLQNGPLGQYVLNPIMDQAKQAFSPLTNALQSAMQPSQQQASVYDKNKPFVNADMGGGYSTTLPPLVESQFRNWAGQNNLPTHVGGTPEYDLRGFYNGLMNNHPQTAGFNPSSGSFPHFWTTPYSTAFSNQSQWARPNAPPPSSNGWSF